MSLCDAEFGPTIRGYCDERFALVRAVFKEITRGSSSAAVAVRLWGEPMVDLTFASRPAPALFHTWSVIKPVTGICLLLLAKEKTVSLDTPVRSIWPTLTAAKSGTMLVRHVLGHAAGLVSLGAVGRPVELIDWFGSVARLAQNAPDWPSGRAVGEHAFTYGHVVGELVRRIDGRSLGRFMADEIASPLHLDIHIGVRTEDVRRIVDTDGLDERFWAHTLGPPDSLRYRALGGGVDTATINSAAWRAAEVPAVNGHASADALAAFYAYLLAGRLPAEALRPAHRGMDRVLSRQVTWTFAGAQYQGDRIGMGGIGGQYAGMLPSRGLSWAFLCSRMSGRENAHSIERAVRASLEPCEGGR